MSPSLTLCLKVWRGFMLPHSILPLCLSTMLRLVTFGMPTKVKGQFTRISFLTSFVPFPVEEIVPHELLSTRYVEYPYFISKSSLFWTTQSSIYLYCTGVFLILKFQIKVKPAVWLYWTVFVVVVFLLYFGELTFYINLSMTLSWIKESKCSTISYIY